MELSRVIIQSPVTEKSERLKAERTYTLQVAPRATKVDIQNALEQFFDVEVESVRVMKVRAKVRSGGPMRTITKRSPSRKALVTLTKKSKALDLAQFRTS